MRPAAWSVDAQGIPKQFPSYGFFGISAEVCSMTLNQWSMNVVATGLYKIGKKTIVFVAELVQQLKSRNVDIDRLAGYRIRRQGTNIFNKKKLLNRWHANLPNTCNLGYPPWRPLTPLVNHVC